MARFVRREPRDDRRAERRVERIELVVLVGFLRGDETGHGLRDARRTAGRDAVHRDPDARELEAAGQGEPDDVGLRPLTVALGLAGW